MHRRPRSCNSVHQLPVAMAASYRKVCGSHQWKCVLMALETRSPKSRCWQGRVSVRGSIRDASSLPPLGPAGVLGLRQHLPGPCLCPHRDLSPLSLCCESPTRSPVLGHLPT